MKKSVFFLIGLLLILFSNNINAQACATPSPVPFLQSFSTGALPACWTNQNPVSTSANALWRFSGTPGYGATANGKPAGTYAWVDASTPNAGLHNVELISPQINTTGLTVPYVKFEWFKNNSSTGAPADNNQLKVEVNNGTGWVQIFANTSNDPAWRTVGIPLAAAYVNATIQLRFTVDKDLTGNGDFYDDLLLDEVQVLEAPTCFETTNQTATVNGPTSATLAWNAPMIVPANGYEYYVSTTNTAPLPATVGTAVAATTVNPPGLISSSTYYWWVRSVCSATDKSLWTAGGSFTLPQVPATLPYVQPFTTGPVDFSFVNGTEANKWHYGSAAGNPANAIYVSDDNGVTNSYNSGSSSVTHAYRDIVIPAGSAMATLSFDWKSFGDDGTIYDYMRVWMVPTSFIPAAGTQIAAGAGRIQVGANFQNVTTWQNYFNPTLNVSSFAGQTMRLVFSWRNDGIVGTDPPAAVDNINLSIPTCQVPTNLTFNSLTANSATIAWTAASPAPANGYQYYLSTTNTPPTAGSTPTGTSTTTSVPLTPLTPNTTYYFWVRSNCGGGDFSFWMSGGSFTTGQIPATLPYSQPFTTGPVDFTLNNGSQTNKWFFGAAAGNPANSIYVSDDNGATNSYDTGSTSVVHAYRDFVIPAGSTIATLFFDWRNDGEGSTTGTSWDYIRVWMVPLSYAITPGTQITTGGGRIQIGGNFVDNPNWQTYFNPTVNVSSFAASGTMRLVFEWRNDGGGGIDPPGAIDNINLAIPTCQVPTNLNFNSVTATSANITWNAANPVPANGYQYYYSTSNTPPTAGTIPSGSSTTTSAPLTPLTPNTTYYFWVRSNCGGGDTSFWMPGGSFTTGQIPATLPYVQPFTTGPVDFTFVNGNQTNKWHYGAAEGNPPNAIYVSNDNGVTNAYDTGSTSVVHAYRDIAIPTGTTDVLFEYDWKSDGENNWDYVRVWLVPTTYMPVAGTQIPAGPGRIQIGANHQDQTTWLLYSNPTQDLSSFAGQTMRLVFSWRNDGGGGTNPPGAIDNIRIARCSNDAPVITVSGITHDEATVTWPQDPGNASYVIRYRPVGSTTWVTVPIASAYPATTNTYNLINLTPSTLYEVEVAAVCNNTPGAYTHTEFETPCDPAPPTNVTITNITSSSALVTWDPVPTATYVFEWRRVGDPVWLPAPGGNPMTGTSVQLDGLIPYTTYEVRVATICSGAQNPFGTPRVFQTEPTCEMAPIGLTVTNITPTQAQVDWDSFPGATYVLRYRKVGSSNWTTINLTVNTYMLLNLEEQTQYELQVANVCNGTLATWTAPYVFTTPTVTYCDMTPHATTGEYISNVTVTPNGKDEMSNDSAASPYTSFVNNPATLIELIQGSSNNTISVEKDWAGTSSNAAVTVWIDFNRDGVFANDERILVSGPSTSSPVTATFSVPNDAYVSLVANKYVTMRVAMQKDNAPAMCTSLASGEVEDYKVRITKPGADNLIDINEIMVYPNPTKDVLNITKVNNGADYTIYNSIGQLIQKGKIIGGKIDVRKLINGVYVIDVDNKGTTAQIKFIKE